MIWKTAFVRFLALQTLMLWQGGFLFYALVVVPVGGRVLGGETLQGFITQRVTNWLNLFAFFSLAMLAVDIQVHPRFRKPRRICLLIAVAMQFALVLLHRELDASLDLENRVVENRRRFYQMHAAYLIVSGLQWLVMLAAAWLMLRSVEQSPHSPEAP